MVFHQSTNSKTNLVSTACNHNPPTAPNENLIEMCTNNDNINNINQMCTNKNNINRPLFLNILSTQQNTTVWCFTRVTTEKNQPNI